jgi:multiple sugar transport system permease protein
LKTYALIYILTDGGPGISTETVTYHIYRLGFVSSDMGRASALSYLLSLVIVGLTIILVFRGRRAAFVTA